MDERIAWLHFASIPGLGPIRGGAFLQKYSLLQLWEADASQLQQWGMKADQVSFWLKRSQNQYDETLRWLDVPHHHLLTLDHPDYPLLLQQIPDPPLVLFVSGSVARLHEQQIAMVGSRHPSADGRRAAVHFASALAERGIIVTSGLAKGIDAICHQAAVQKHLPTIAVQGCGLQFVYPAAHHQLAAAILAEGGAIISEFFPSVRPRPEFFPRRNRIISGLSMGTVVIEAAEKSGSLITAYSALEQGREVFAVPGVFDNPNARGCLRLIQKGAKLICDLADIEDELGSFGSVIPQTDSNQTNANQTNVSHIPPKIEEVGPSDLPFPRLLDNVRRDEATSIDVIVAKSGLPVQVVMAELVNLELEGWVQSVPGGYVRTRSA